ncbi:MAG: hypothetical protein JXM68_08725 [Sedimentisphaerales bacterium]|nr:hypothetical protein [Sedimentisphaerales bacterium]
METALRYLLSAYAARARLAVATVEIGLVVETHDYASQLCGESLHHSDQHRNCAV